MNNKQLEKSILLILKTYRKMMYTDGRGAANNYAVAEFRRLADLIVAGVTEELTGERITT